MIVFIPVGLIASLISSCAKSGERREERQAQYRVVQPAARSYVPVAHTLPNSQQAYQIPQQQVVAQGQQYQHVPQQMPQVHQPQVSGAKTDPAQVRPKKRKPWQRRFKGGYSYYEQSQ